ncbi:Hsp70 family protein [Geothermobacter hydrogeniphilus]|uniref:Uncharacterized protein n=1 Tax=Geothermobacter hydrogeniphilus TaxID=1969733 RepID=A0A1X0Y8B7_9BACT|nr:Hsp70 family protein [Geothermobacter hydrogeniphilus]ORJ61356.1 hypothetical protein B5V00_06905 [Geothermobacter hydrogeniphilus]
MSILDLIGLSQRGSQQTLFEEEQLRVLGIDLGTTNSTIAEIVFDPDTDDEPAVRCLPVEQPTAGRSHWSPLVPSLLALHDGTSMIGEGARLLREHGREEQLVEKGNLFSCVKNDMGLQRTYHMAPAGYRSAAEISGHLLQFLHEAAMQEKPQIPVRTSITVPASFQAAQRDDTIKAARMAGLHLEGGDLLDEPIAALVSYLARNEDIYDVAMEDPITMLVFDFGGGTCDVAVIHLEPHGECLSFYPQAVSRYHRLGGHDLDQAIFYDVLLPQILEQNNLSPFDLDYDIKKNILEPAFIGIAEQLKIRICEKLQRADNVKADARQIQPDDYECVLPDGRTIRYENPTLTAEQLREALDPFLDPHALFARETEYRQTLSIFAPIIDALDRCEMEPEEITACLLVGGSSLNPLVRNALENWFDNSVLLTFDNEDQMQLAVAEGAAINALSLAVSGRPVVLPVCPEAIALRTRDGELDLVPRGAQLPWPESDDFHHAIELRIPQAEDEETKTVSVRVEVVAKEKGAQRSLLGEVWEIPAPRGQEERVALEYSFDRNQVLNLRLSHLDRDDVAPFVGRREHPLTHVVNPQRVKLRIRETEEKLRTGQIPAGRKRGTILQLAGDCSELRQYEKALALLADYQRNQGEGDPAILNMMGIYAGYMGDRKSEEKFYRLCIEQDGTDGTPWFNLALLKRKEKLYDEALDAIREAIELEPDCAPYLVFKAGVLQDSGKDFAAREFLAMAERTFPPMDEQSSWEMHWYGILARQKGDKELQEEISRHRKTHSSSNTHRDIPDQAVFPIFVEAGQ